jgi:hypothetical protein
MVSSAFRSNAVIKMWSAVKTGEECPGGSAVLQTMFFSASKRSGRPFEGETPAPFGPRNCVQSAAPSVIGINSQPSQRIAISLHGVIFH